MMETTIAGMFKTEQRYKHKCKISNAFRVEDIMDQGFVFLAFFGFEDILHL